MTNLHRINKIYATREQLQHHNRTQELVNTALENARRNGYDYSTADPELVATDLGTCDADLEGREDLAPYVRVWQQGGVS